MVERAGHAPAAGHADVAGDPHGALAHVDTEEGVVGGPVADGLGEELGVERLVGPVQVGLAVHRVEPAVPDLAEVVQEAVVALGRDLGLDGLHRLLDVAHQADGDRCPTAEVLDQPVDLDDLDAVRDEPVVGEVRAQHDEDVAVPDGVVAGRVADEAGQADDVRVAVVEDVLGPQRVDDGSVQLLGEGQHLVAGVPAADAAEDRDLLALVDGRRRPGRCRCRRGRGAGVWWVRGCRK